MILAVVQCFDPLLLSPENEEVVVMGEEKRIRINRTRRGFVLARSGKVPKRGRRVIAFIGQTLQALANLL
jgi:hypothetical protein